MFSVSARVVTTVAQSGWPPSSAGLGVVGRALELDRHHRFVADDPRVVSGSDPVHLATDHVGLAAVGMGDVDAAGQAVADVLDLAAVGAHDGLDALGPLPAGLECVAPDLAAGDVHELDGGLVGSSGLIGCAEVSMFDTSHGRSPSVQG